MKSLVGTLCFLGFFATLAGFSCRGDERSDSPVPDAGRSDAARDAGGFPDTSLDVGEPPASDAPLGPTFCSLPGSVVSTSAGQMVVAGAPVGTPDIGWLNVPVGFCAHYFGTVPTVRQLRFSPSGDLFAASPDRPTTGGANNGVRGVLVLPDDNSDGIADSAIAFVTGVGSVQGVMFSSGSFFYQDDTVVRRIPYQAGDRKARAAGVPVTDMGVWNQAGEHWPRVFDTTRDGLTTYITNGGSQNDKCVSPPVVRGGIFRLNADGSTALVATGFRNPIALRCESNHDVCLAIELALDYSDPMGGREKIAPVRSGDDWGYPCCATKDVPYAGVTYDGTTVPDCSRVASESDSFIIGHTPFGLDFERGVWPAPWRDRVFVTLHGDFATWVGARIVAVALDPATGLPLSASELPEAGVDPSNMLEFATGWDDGRQDHGRPAPVAFAPDGRLFVGDDQRGAVIWIAPIDLVRP